MIAKIKHKLQRRRIVKTLGSFDEKALWKATSIGHHDHIVSLIEGGVGINSQNEQGKTALMLAAQKGQVDTLSLLISKGASVDLGDHEQMTALMIAAKQGHLDCVETLIEAGAEVNRRDEDGLTPLIVAVKEGNTAIVRCLLKADADPNSKDNEGKNVLSYAKFSPSLEKILVQNGAEPTKEPIGDTIESIPYLGQNVKNVLRSVGDEIVKQEQVEALYGMIQKLGLLLQFKYDPDELDPQKINEQFENIKLGLDILLKLRDIVMNFASIVMALFNKSQESEAHPQEFFEDIKQTLNAIDEKIQELELQAESQIDLEITIPHEVNKFKDVILQDWLVEEGAQVEMGQRIAQLRTDDGLMDLKAIQEGNLKHIVRSGSKVKVGEVIGMISP